MFEAQRRGRYSLNIWPGFVDSLATILLVFVFVLLLFVVGQSYLSQVLTGQSQALEQLHAQVDQLAQTLSLEREHKAQVEAKLSRVYQQLHATLAERAQLRSDLQLSQIKVHQLQADIAQANERVNVSQRQLKLRLSEIASLQADIDTLRKVRETLEAKVGELVSHLEHSRGQLSAARDRTKALEALLAEAQERTQLAQKTLQHRDIRIQDLVAQIEERQEALAHQHRLSAAADAKLGALRRQLQALQEQISALAAALHSSKQTVVSQKVQLRRLGEQLNVALVKKVKELSYYRSEFFGRLRQVLGDVPEIRVVGDRFMFQSELFFPSGSAQIAAPGKDKLDRLATVLEEVSRRIPGDVDWVLQVDGHTDRRPIHTPRFPSNWELSTARALSIVHYLVTRGVPPNRLAAAGYGQYDPIDSRDSPQALARNRRIELRLTSR
ncbi:peptidoglycan -binding protein [Nitrococcus mobilis]|uniref:OmpA/MotB n=1 Tax=Nitrococcus mobilis Nb-231 TaxID=314278 RepID=A4BPA6_9GAMM|nr:peptidoglycan -binding protein [Nitrococcus mobilis]EAR22407.1 OmpA/MotB [Nitrococcus mobilis Nb-231]